MALERGRPASSVDRAVQGWRREAVEARDTIAKLREELADTIAERDSLMRDLEATRRDLSQLEVRHHDLQLEHKIIVGLIRATEARKAADNG
jgi:hypothetical protein